MQEQQVKSNIFKKIYRFFVPEGGFMKNLYGGMETGQKIGKKRAEEYQKKKEAKDAQNQKNLEKSKQSK